jgi:hypothetical protein
VEIIPFLHEALFLICPRASARTDAEQRKELERMCRYITSREILDFHQTPHD